MKIADDKSIIIPGHGPVSNKKELLVYLSMLKQTRDAVVKLIYQKKDLDAIIKAQPTKEFDEKWGRAFLKPEDYVRLLYASLAKK